MIQDYFMIFVFVLHFFVASLYFSFLQNFISIHLNQINIAGKFLLHLYVYFQINYLCFD